MNLPNTIAGSGRHSSTEPTCRTRRRRTRAVSAVSGGQARGSLLSLGSGRGAGATRCRPEPGVDGSADTTAGSNLEDSARSITSMRRRSASPSIGAVITRVDGAPQSGHEIVAGAVPIGRLTSTRPSTSQRYLYVAIRAPLDVDDRVHVPCGSNGNIFLGNYSGGSGLSTATGVAAGTGQSCWMTSQNRPSAAARNTRCRRCRSRSSTVPRGLS